MKQLLLALLLTFCAFDAAAWSRDGHELVGELAQRRLSPAARAEVDRLLAGEPVPTLAGVATWADDLRAAGRSHGDALGERSERWHFLNFPDGVDCAYVPARDCPGGDCVVAAISAQQAILADHSRTDAERAQALKFLVHFVGDVHQPMHAGFAGDRGGNRYQVSYRGRGARHGDEGTNLHRIWDYWVLAGADLDGDAYADRLEARSAVAVEPLPSAAGAPAAWAIESCRIIADTPLYPRRADGREQHVLDDDYVDRLRPIAERRVLQAAFRLAALIEAAVVPAR